MTEIAPKSTIPDYFNNVRREIEPLLPAAAPRRILEIGCSAGGTLAWLKGKWPDAETVGVDGFDDVRAVLSERVDTALIRNLDEPLPDLGQFDIILALDVLEHLREPREVTRQLAGMLTDAGTLIVSVPNIAHHSALLPLLLRGRFRYTDEGILDHTHLRFFTEDSVRALIEDAGLFIATGLTTGFGGKQRIVDRMTLGAFRRNLVWQYIVRAEKRPSGAFRWLRSS